MKSREQYCDVVVESFSRSNGRPQGSTWQTSVEAEVTERRTALATCQSPHGARARARRRDPRHSRAGLQQGARRHRSLLTLFSPHLQLSFPFQFRNSKLELELSEQTTDDDATGDFVEALEQSVTSLRRWAERVPGFGDLNREDQTLLFQNAAFELASLRMALRYERVTSFPQ